MSSKNKKAICSGAENNKDLQRLLALYVIENSVSSKALTRSEMLRLFRITPEENKMANYFETEEFKSRGV